MKTVCRWGCQKKDMTFLPKLSVSCLFFDNIRPLYLIPLPFLHASLRLTESIKPSTHSPCFSCWQEYCKPENHCISVICLLSAYKQISIRSACLSVPLSLVSPPCPQFPLRRLCARPSAVLDLFLSPSPRSWPPVPRSRCFGSGSLSCGGFSRSSPSVFV